MCSPFEALSTEDAKWLQQRLVTGGYLKKTDIDGITGSKTIGAFNAWKLDSFQASPGIIGSGSVELLNAIAPLNPISEQTSKLGQKADDKAGSRSGKDVILPVVGRVFANQWIDPRFPYFTWGELTDGLNRLPKTTALVRNGLALVKAIGIVRDKQGIIWRVTSAYRTPEVNRAVGGATRSTHLLFRGCDVSPSNGDFSKLVAIARATPEIKGIGFGQRRGFIHLDIGWSDKDLRREFSY